MMEKYKDMQKSRVKANLHFVDRVYQDYIKKIDFKKNIEIHQKQFQKKHEFHCQLKQYGKLQNDHLNISRNQKEFQSIIIDEIADLRRSRNIDLPLLYFQD